jgi:competence protein ComEC
MLALLRKLPVSRLLLPYVIGILVLGGHISLLVSLLAFGLWGLSTYTFLSKRLPGAWSIRWLPGASLFLLWLALGGLGASRIQEQANFPDETRFEGDACLLSQPQEKPKSVQVAIRIERTPAGFEAWQGKRLLAYLPKGYRGLEAGDRIRLELRPKRPEPPNSVLGFDFGAWLQRKGICGTVYSKKIALLSKASSWNITAQADRMRQHLIHRFVQAGIQGKELALVSALVLGATDHLGNNTKRDFSISGISHVLSVSGLHVAVVYAVLAFLLSFADKWEAWRMPKQLFLVFLLFVYAFLTGLSPSVLRSAFMFSLLAMGKCFHRKSHTLNTVLFSAFVLLLWNPAYLYDLGFQLSYLAVLCIVTVHPRLVALWTPRGKPLRYLWEMLCLSLVAQLGTSPLTIHAFHTFPNYFLFNNLVAVPFSSLLIYLALAFLMLADLPGLGSVLALLLEKTLHGFLFMVETTARFPHALTEHLYPSTLEAAAFYVLLLTAFACFLWGRRRWVFAFLLAVLAFQCIGLAACFGV